MVDAYRPAVDNAAKRPRGPASRGGPETLVVVDDDDCVRKLLAVGLATYGYTVLSASTGDEALRAVELHPGLISLLLTDVMLPGMNGRTLAKILCKRSPSLRVLFTSGYSEVDAQLNLRSPTTGFVQKPCTLDGLERKVRSLLDASVAGISPDA